MQEFIFKQMKKVDRLEKLASSAAANKVDPRKNPRKRYIGSMRGKLLYAVSPTNRILQQQKFDATPEG